MSRREYAEVRDSGVAWLGEVPAHWEVLNCKFGYSIQLGKMLQNERQSPEDVQVPYLKAAHVQWEKVGIADLPEMWASPHDFTKFSVKNGDLLVCEGGEAGRAGVLAGAPNNCIIQNALHRVRPKQNNSIKYLMYLLEIAGHSKWLDILCNKATIAHFTGEKFGWLAVSLPPAKEQIAIADFLDRETARIDALIEKKKQQIALLKEKRIALISHAVTNGLDSNAAMKDSGVEWLGAIPAHWEASRMKRVCSPYGLYGANLSADNYMDAGIRFIRTTDITNDGRLIRGGVSLPEELVGDYMLSDGDVLISRSGTIGRSFLYDSHSHGSCCYAGYLVRFVPTSRVLPRFLFLFTKTRAFAGYIQSMAISSTIENVNAEKYANTPLPLPALSEQAAIVAFLDKETARIDALTEKVKQSVDLLREYRTALISASVTGKIDVR